MLWRPDDKHVAGRRAAVSLCSWYACQTGRTLQPLCASATDHAAAACHPSGTPVPVPSFSRTDAAAGAAYLQTRRGFLCTFSFIAFSRAAPHPHRAALRARSSLLTLTLAGAALLCAVVHGVAVLRHSVTLYCYSYLCVCGSLTTSTCLVAYLPAHRPNNTHYHHALHHLPSVAPRCQLLDKTC